MEAYGDVDELNSFLGGLVASLPPEGKDLAQEIERIQSDLLQIGALLSATPGSPISDELVEITEEQSKAIEAAIDRMEEELPVLRDFLLPGGHMSAAWAHVARTVCRRAERHVVRLATTSAEAAESQQLKSSVVYLNRLSDYLFVVARYCNKMLKVTDKVWKK